MCCMNPDDKSDFLEEFLEEYDLKLEDMAYLKHLDGRKTFPEWVYNTTQPFPSQLIPDKFVIPTVVENYCLRYVCNVEPCKDNIIRNSQQMRIHIFIVHKSQVRRETDVFFGCPAQVTEGCEAIARCNTKDMISHVKAVHPLLCGKPGCSGRLWSGLKTVPTTCASSQERKFVAAGCHDGGISLWDTSPICFSYD
ncbi:uncharacterized protein LOC129592128 [Paramacrobiotus metropolitanus]|uniref:uncharacterized protein LOC129592128 n=1 Tax=Paramacrobiotus metropolitanus TaxID=2943436 RepID=UPI0024456C36|nr:uncharacterized protein LOC129592128 [Paramacrobiotus metropolitanus]